MGAHSLDPEIVRKIEAFLTVQASGTLELDCKDGEIVQLRIVGATLWRQVRQRPEGAASNGRGA